MKKDEFKGILGLRYHRLIQAVPSYRNVQKAVAQTICKIYKQRGFEESHIVEIGSGYGTTIGAIVRTDMNCTVTGVEKEQDMLQSAEIELSQYKCQNKVRLVLADALKYLQGLETESIDVIASAYTFHNWNHNYRWDVLIEIYRVLRPQGLFVNGDKYANDNEAQHFQNFYDQISSFFNHFKNSADSDLLQAAVMHYISDESPDRLIKESSAKAELLKIGFQKAQSITRFQLEAVVQALK
jgi:ubiquinone/menaquinone biosynthesis C-methylase UbiE